jgi:hypothetical protein
MPEAATAKAGLMQQESQKSQQVLEEEQVMRVTMSKALLALALFAGMSVLGQGAASAKVIRQSEGSFMGAEVPGGALGEPLGSVAVDQETGDVYVLETNASELGKGVVDKFDAGGHYAGVQITGAHTSQGSFAMGISSAVAVDGSAGLRQGDVYVSDTEHHVVDRFSETGAFECQIAGAETEAALPSATECDALGSGLPGAVIPTGLAVNASGDVYVANDASGVIDEFGAGGEFLGEIADTHLTTSLGSIALDSAGNLYVNNFLGSVVEFDAAGAFVSEIGGASAEGVAVDPVTDDVFLAGGADVAEYEPSGGLVGLFGEGAAGFFHFGLAVDGSSEEVYVAGWFGQGRVTVFGPAVVVPTVTTGAVSEVHETSADVSGRVDPDAAHAGGSVTECEFEYGTSTAYGQTAPCSPAGPYPAATGVSAGLSALAPSTTYHFRLVAANANKIASAGEDGTFTTSGPPAVDSEAATAESNRASVRAQINPFGFDTTCQVQYVSEAGFQESGYAGAANVPCASDLGSGWGDQTAHATLSGLRMDTTYHYRFLATSQVGTTTGADQTFATAGIKSFSFEVLDREGQPYTQAGGHPYELVDSFTLNQSTLANGTVATDENVKDIITELPKGLVGNPIATPRCTHFDFTGEKCAGTTQVGVLHVETNSANVGESQDVGVFNIVPPPDVPAEFAAHIGNLVDVYIEANVRNGDYGVTATSPNTTMVESTRAVRLTMWGVPAESAHNSERYCPGPAHYESGCASSAQPEPFLTNPTSCTGPQTATMRVNSWQDIGEYATATATVPAVTGCDRLDFTPSISVLPDTAAADSPSGVSVDLHVPQSEALTGLATPNLRDVTVTLPAGVTLNPAAANGLQACSQAQIGIDTAEEPTCPDASKVGSVEVETPLLADRLRGSVYLAEQDNNPFGSMLALYVTAAADGVLIKVPGQVEANPLTGQLTSTFLDNPQLPFSDFKLHFFGGPRAPLATPDACGTYTTTSSLTPWSAPESGPPATPSSSFQITSGPGGAQCAAQGFAGGLQAGTTSNQAGGFSPFTLTMSRNDGEQNLGTVSTILPPGVVGALGKVPLCPEAQANAGTCPAASQIGHVTVGVGAGPDPLFVPAPGKPADPIYLTGPYKGAPFGLSVVVPAEAGPFNLDENGPVVVRAAVNVDPHTAQVTVTTDPLPQILKGIPLDIRSVNATIDRPEFMINPTSCEPKQIEGDLTSSLGAKVTDRVPFQVTNCAALAFKPKLTASTSGKTSRANGASFGVKLTYPAGPYDANIARVKVELPKQLPSRLTTLQKACTAAVFEANPANCPAASIIGHASATTPVLPVALTGPAYFVSHGGEAFPSLVIVLQGYGLTVDLVGSTFISSKGITSSTFKTVPDVPVGTFELTLPQGPYSALTANANLCNAKQLAMPTEFVAQNGALVKTTTKIQSTGCPKAKTAKRKRKAKARKHGKRAKADAGGRKRR